MLNLNRCITTASNTLPIQTVAALAAIYNAHSRRALRRARLRAVRRLRFQPQGTRLAHAHVYAWHHQMLLALVHAHHAQALLLCLRCRQCLVTQLSLHLLREHSITRFAVLQIRSRADSFRPSRLVPHASVKKEVAAFGPPCLCLSHRGLGFIRFNKEPRELGKNQTGVCSHPSM